MLAEKLDDEAIMALPGLRHASDQNVALDGALASLWGEQNGLLPGVAATAVASHRLESAAQTVARSAESRAACGHHRPCVGGALTEGLQAAADALTRHHGPRVARALSAGLRPLANEVVRPIEPPAGPSTAPVAAGPREATTPKRSGREKRALSRLAANVWLAACLVLALGICLSPFIGGASRRLTNSQPGPSTRQADAPGRPMSAWTSALATAAYQADTHAFDGATHRTAIDNLDAAGSELDGLPCPIEASDAVLTLAQGEAAPAAIEYLYRPIEDLREGDVVVATDPGTGETHLARVVQTFQRITYHLRHLVLQDSTGRTQHIETTDEHPFFVPSAGNFVPAGRLRVGDTLRGPLGEPLYVIETNFEVETLHTYYICAHGARAPPALVHNASCDRHHPFAKFLGGHEKQKLTKLPRQVHKEFHASLRSELRAAVFTRPVGGRKGSTARWLDDFARNPGSQRAAIDALFRASRAVDMKFGTHITQDLWENIVHGRFESFP